jgi:hypothetical protein
MQACSLWHGLSQVLYLFLRAPQAACSCVNGHPTLAIDLARSKTVEGDLAHHRFSHMLSGHQCVSGILHVLFATCSQAVCLCSLPAEGLSVTCRWCAQPRCHSMSRIWTPGARDDHAAQHEQVLSIASNLETRPHAHTQISYRIIRVTCMVPLCCFHVVSLTCVLPWLPYRPCMLQVTLYSSHSSWPSSSPNFSLVRRHLVHPCLKTLLQWTAARQVSVLKARAIAIPSCRQDCRIQVTLVSLGLPAAAYFMDN